MRILELIPFSLLATLVSSLIKEEIANLDRFVVTCGENWMGIQLKKDLNEFNLRGDQPECVGKTRETVDDFGKKITVKTWNLTLKEGGACGMRASPLEMRSPLKHYEVTIYGKKQRRELSCTETGVLDKRDARILVHQMRGEAYPLTPSGGETEVEVERGAMLRATFQSSLDKSADISLHPLQCWLLDESLSSRRLVIDGGCPLYAPNSNHTFVVIGSDDADHVTGSHPHVFFNAEAALFPDDTADSLPRFRLQCSVFPCRGKTLREQLVGVDRCPPVAWCQTEKRLEKTPQQLFEIDQPFSLRISSYRTIAKEDYRRLVGPLYPLEYWTEDSEAGDHAKKQCLFLALGLGGGSLALALITLICLRKRLQSFLRAQWMALDQTPVYPEKIHEPSKAMIEKEDVLPFKQ